MDTILSSPFESGSMPGSQRFSKAVVLRDYRLAVGSRHVSALGRGEVFSGKAKFGIFGDGKEVAQVALAHAFRKGDFRSGYYRDQTLMFALGLSTYQELFAQLYAHADLDAEPAFGGRSMTGHFASRLIRPDGTWKDALASYNSTADLSPTGSQMPRLVGLAYASVLYRRLKELQPLSAGFSDRGNEIAFGTIGNASCAEGIFWESVNAAGVLQVPILLSIWDDGYGISVPNQFQMTKGDISRALEGFQRKDGDSTGVELYSVRGWDYPRLCEVYLRAAEEVRHSHTPAIIHITELTQPFGHSTSGSQERYKSAERLTWEKQADCIRMMRLWIVEQGLLDEAELDAAEQEEKQAVEKARDLAWQAYRAPIEEEAREIRSLVLEASAGEGAPEALHGISDSLQQASGILRRDLMAAAEEALIELAGTDLPAAKKIRSWRTTQAAANRKRYGSDLYSSSAAAAVQVPEVPAILSEDSPLRSGYEIINACFDAAFERYPNLIAMGEDVGQLGGVNQGFAHLQKKYGSYRITDTGIREATILGQAIGMALRGLKPIAEIQYIDYLLYAIQIMSDDLASLRWRTCGGQKAPVIIRTRGHRLEGIWHSGSPMAGIINLVRGIYVCVPRDAVQAAGFYNTMLRSDDTALIVEVLNAYRKKSRMPDNIGTLTIPLGVPETLRTGADVTVVTYGACCAIAGEAALLLARAGIEVELIDARTLLPFDSRGIILESIKKTNRILFVDEDVPGGATAFMLQQVLEIQGGYQWLDAPPRTLTACEHRPAYGSDGDYFSKPNREDIFEAVYDIMREGNPRKFPALSE